MPVFAQTEERIFGEIMSDLLTNTNISRTSPGSKMRALAEAVSKKLGIMWNQFDLNMGQAFIDGAEGQWLNYFGDMMGVERLGKEPASISTDEENVRFYVDTGTFGDINDGSSILIPAGTHIGTEDAGTGTIYRTITGTTLLSTEDSTYIAVQSVRDGSTVNVGAGQLVFHDFSDYADYVNDSLKVTNDAEITKGKDPESDLNYRYRIVNQITSLEKANEISIRLAALLVPGVADVVMIPYQRGIGTYDLVIKGTTPNVGDGLIASVQQAVEKVTAYGIGATVKGPIEIGVSVVGTLYLKKKVTAEEESNILETTQNNVIDYINNLDIGEELVVNQMLERVINSSNMIKTVGISSKPFDSMFVYYPSRLEDNKVRSELITDLAPKADEKFIVENVYAGASPILFRIG